MPRFSVTYEIWSEESAETGDTDERGYVIEEASFRDALAAYTSTRTNSVDGYNDEPSCSDLAQARWFTRTNGMEYETGEQEIRSLHIPNQVTPASRRRIARLIKSSSGF